MLAKADMEKQVTSRCCICTSTSDHLAFSRRQFYSQAIELIAGNALRLLKSAAAPAAEHMVI